MSKGPGNYAIDKAMKQMGGSGNVMELLARSLKEEQKVRKMAPGVILAILTVNLVFVVAMAAALVGGLVLTALALFGAVNWSVPGIALGVLILAVLGIRLMKPLVARAQAGAKSKGFI